MFPKNRIALLLILSISLWAIPLQTAHAQTFRPVVRGKRGVVAGGHPLSVEAGLRILQHGGNAVDAGVATVLAASVIEFSHFSFGGEVPILIKLRGGRPIMSEGSDKTHNVVVIQGMGQAPMKAKRELFANRTTHSGSSNESTAPDSAKAQSFGTDMPTMAGAKSGSIPATGPLAATVPAVLAACVTALEQPGPKSLP